jgi:hypothetical protein
MFFFFFPENKVGCRLRMTFEVPKYSITLKEFNQFLDAINDFHDSITNVLEYKDESIRDAAESKAELKDLSNKLSLVNLTRVNPYNIVLEFYEHRETIMMVWAYWKGFIKVCKRYGSSAENLEDTINDLKELISDQSSAFYVKYAKHLQFSQEQINLQKKEIDGNLKKLLSNHKFKRSYNLFCKTSITITEILVQIQRISGLSDSPLEEDLLY